MCNILYLLLPLSTSNYILYRSRLKKLLKKKVDKAADKVKTAADQGG